MRCVYNSDPYRDRLLSVVAARHSQYYPLLLRGKYNISKMGYVDYHGS